MKRVHFLLFTVCCLSLTVFLWSCGNGPGSPGSTGSENTGVVVDATITPVPSYSVDAFQGYCCGTEEIASGAACSTGTPTLERFTDQDATVTINASLLNPNTKFQVGTLYVEKYTVEFRRSTDSIGAPPIEEIIDGTVGMPVVITPPTGTSISPFTTTVVLVDLTRKIQYASDIASGNYTPNNLNNYTAIYTFYGENEFGQKFSFQAQTGFQIGDFNNCGG